MYLDTSSHPTRGLLIISRGILLAALSLSIQEQREQVKKSYQRLLSIADALEKRRQKQSNITDSPNDTPLATSLVETSTLNRVANAG